MTLMCTFVMAEQVPGEHNRSRGRVVYRALGIVLLWCVAATAADAAPSEDVTITLERTTCYGTCPAYKVSIRGDGSVVYEGKKFVRVEGTRQTIVDKAAVAQLVQAFTDAGYFELKDHYRSIQNPDGTETMVTDLPTAYTSLSLNGRHKAVEDYVGAPKKLVDLERNIDDVAGSKRWVAIDAAAVHDEARHGWDVRGLEAQRLLQRAAEAGDVDTVRAFIEEGGDVNARAGITTPLQQARGAEVVKLLVSAGADVNATSKEYCGPPLNFAAELGDTDSIRALLDAGAKVNGRSPDGETPLMKAARSGNPEAVQALLHAGARVNARDNHGEDALKFAGLGLARQDDLAKNPDPFEEAVRDYTNKYKEIVDMLIAAGATDEKPVTK
jgi:hypothetical protein